MYWGFVCASGLDYAEALKDWICAAGLICAGGLVCSGRLDCAGDLAGARMLDYASGLDALVDWNVLVP